MYDHTYSSIFFSVMAVEELEHTVSSTWFWTECQKVSFACSSDRCLDYCKCFWEKRWKIFREIISCCFISSCLVSSQIKEDELLEMNYLRWDDCNNKSDESDWDSCIDSISFDNFMTSLLVMLIECLFVCVLSGCLARETSFLPSFLCFLVESLTQSLAFSRSHVVNRLS